MAPQSQIRTIIVRNQVQGSKELVALAKRYGALNKNVAKSTKILSRFQGVLGTFGAFFGIRELKNAADSIQLLQDRIKVFVGDSDKAKETLGDLARAAKFTRASLDVFADGFNRIAIATKDAGLSTNAIIKVTTALQQTLRLSGSNAQEASSVFLQLGQALSLGRLQGQELRSVLLGNAELGKLLASEFDVLTGALRELGEQGRLTNDRVLKALLDNFENLNIRASNLRTTIGQGLTIAFDTIRLKIADLNEKFNIGGTLVKGISFLVDNFGNLFTVITIFVTSNILGKLALQIQGINKAIIAGKLFELIANPNKFKVIAASLGIIAFGITKLIASAKKARPLEEVRKDIKTTLPRLKLLRAEYQELQKDNSKQGKFTAERFKTNVLDRYIRKLSRLRAEEGQAIKESESTFDSYLNKLLKTNAEFTNQSGLVNNLKDNLAALNKQYQLGLITLQEYRDQNIAIQVEELNRKFKDGAVDVDSYNSQLDALTLKLSSLGAGGGIITGLVVGMKRFADNTKTLAEDVAGFTESIFSNLEDTLTKSLREWKLDWDSFTKAIADDLARLFVRRTITSQIAGGLSSLAVDIGQANALASSANGNIFKGGQIKPFANGGVVSSPTIFPMRNGAGLMGEAGPEAIMPLVRRNGKLGVEGGGNATIVNVINNSGGEVETKETNENGQRQVDIIINDTVNRAIGEGRFDRTFRSTFGLQRKGS